MQPILYNVIDHYKSTDALYNANGYGFLTECTEFLVTMEKNGDYSFTAKVKSTDKFAKYIKLGSYIKSKPNNKENPQLFFIKKIEIDKNGDLTISGDHVSRLFFQNGTFLHFTYVKDEQSAVEILDELWNIQANRDCWFNLAPYTFFTTTSNIIAKKNFNLGLTTCDKFEKIFNDGAEGLLATYGGELTFNQFAIYYQKPSTTDSGYRIAFGANVSNYKQTASIESYFTHVLPYARCKTVDDTEVVVATTSLYSTGLSKAIKNVYNLDCTSKIKSYAVSPTSGLNYKEVRSELAKQAKNYIYENTDQSAESLSIVVNVEPELTKMHRLKLYDYVTVVMLDGTEIKKKVSKTIFDSVSEKYKEITIGNLDMSMSDLLKIQRRFKK